MDHELYMSRAIQLSRAGLGLTHPNPVVGAVVVDTSGQIIGEGFHQGGPHAEILALKDAAKGGNSTLGASIYVTLEPCNHTGKTPPCTSALVDAKISRVIYAQSDPNPIAAGGADFLRSHGIEIVADVLREESADVNRAWLHKVVNHRPYFTWKIASTFDGFTAALDGTSQWITSQESRDLVQRMRAESDLILIGTGTALADNPSLVPRNDARRPIRMVVGEREIPRDFHLHDRAAQTIFLATRDIQEILRTIKDLDINAVLVEPGAALGTSLLQAGLIDEICWFQAPTILGTGKNAIADLHIQTLNGRIDFNVESSQKIGSDICTRLINKPRMGE